MDERTFLLQGEAWDTGFSRGWGNGEMGDALYRAWSKEVWDSLHATYDSCSSELALVGARIGSVIMEEVCRSARSPALGNEKK